MFFFAIVGGAFAWLALSGALDPTLPEPPSPRDYDTTDEDDRVVGILQNNGETWTSTCGRGRRAFVGDVLAGLSRKDRSTALRVLRGQLKYLSRKGSVAWAFLYFVWGALPLQRSFGGASPALLRRLYAPAAWAYEETIGLSYTEWGDAVDDWCTGDGWVLG
jgi:hypothetical protein